MSSSQSSPELRAGAYSGIVQWGEDTILYTWQCCGRQLRGPRYGYDRALLQGPCPSCERRAVQVRVYQYQLELHNRSEVERAFWILWDRRHPLASQETIDLAASAVREGRLTEELENPYLYTAAEQARDRAMGIERPGISSPVQIPGALSHGESQNASPSGILGGLSSVRAPIVPSAIEETHLWQGTLFSSTTEANVMEELAAGAQLRPGLRVFIEDPIDEDDFSPTTIDESQFFTHPNTLTQAAQFEDTTWTPRPLSPNISFSIRPNYSPPSTSPPDPSSPLVFIEDYFGGPLEPSETGASEEEVLELMTNMNIDGESRN